MKAYNDLVRDVLENGAYKPNKRTGEGTTSVFGRQVRFDLQKEFPLVNSKFTAWKAAWHELLWYLTGTGDIKYLQDNGVKIWNEWVRPGTTQLGRVYGVQWRKWLQYQIVSHKDFLDHHGDGDAKTYFEAKVRVSEIDQVAKLIETIKTNPTDRRMIVTAWNPAELHDMQLPPCHMTWQCNVVNGKLNLHLLQRSVDLGLGVGFNWCNYAMLLHMLAHVTGLEVGEFVWTGVDVHIYENHIDGLKEMLDRPLLENTAKLRFTRKVENIDDFRFEDLVIEDYQYHPSIKLKVAV
jgi:thymidylate synthase